MAMLVELARATLVVMRAAASLDARISLRSFAPEDASFVAKLSDEAFAEYGGRPSRYTLSVIERPTAHSWLAIEEGVPVGLVILEVDLPRAAVLAVAVSRLARGRGIGELLMKHAERQARAHSATRLTLYTADSNLAALDLFLRRGFRIVARKPGFYSRRQDACELTKRLTAPNG
jgi:ribosomal protein S18 acetylase RimI-like enzyme